MCDRETIRVLWEKMAAIYGHKWVSSFGESDDGTWLRVLTGLTKEQIAAGLRACLDRDDVWPPGAAEFRKLCLPVKVPAIHRNYVALPRPVYTPEQIDGYMGKIRKVLKP